MLPGPTPQPPREVEPVNPKDFREAVEAAADMVFVLGGQAVGNVAARRTGDPVDRERWKPTEDERRRIVGPVHRIARRHLTASADMADALDVALLTAGVGSYLTRAAFNLDSLEALDDDPGAP